MIVEMLADLPLDSGDLFVKRGNDLADRGRDDGCDAEILARMVRFDPQLLAPVQHRSEQMQADISLIRARDVLVGARTKLINAGRGLVKSHARSMRAVL